jgi:hypothetical protein
LKPEFFQNFMDERLQNEPKRSKLKRSAEAVEGCCYGVEVHADL